jgi:hypothetical protein
VDWDRSDLSGQWLGRPESAPCPETEGSGHGRARAAGLPPLTREIRVRAGRPRRLHGWTRRSTRRPATTHR